MKFRVTKYIILISLLLTSACSTLNSINPFSEESNPSQKDNKKSGKPSLPFSLEINDEVNDGDRLHILGTISAVTDWSLNDAIVKLSSISEGRVVGISYLPLTKISNKLQSMIKGGEQNSFTISVPSENITDYQLELLWGQEAKQYLTSIRNQPAGILEIRDIKIQTIRQACSNPDCMVKFKVNATLFNQTSKPVKQVILGIGYIRINSAPELDLQRQIPQNEERIDIGQILLAPGDSRSIVISFDQEVPEKSLVNTEGEIKPTIRIISFF